MAPTTAKKKPLQTHGISVIIRLIQAKMPLKGQKTPDSPGFYDLDGTFVPTVLTDAELDAMIGNLMSSAADMGLTRRDWEAMERQGWKELRAILRKPRAKAK